MGLRILELLLINIIMKVFICLSAVLALAHCEPFLTSGPAAGPVHAAVGGLVATKRGYRPIALEGYSEDDNQDGFVDPIGQVAPVVYAAPFGYAGLPYAHHVVPAVKAVEAPKVEVKAAPVAYAHAPFAYAAGYPHVYATHHVVTKTRHLHSHCPRWCCYPHCCRTPCCWWSPSRLCCTYRCQWSPSRCSCC